MISLVTLLAVCVSVLIVFAARREDSTPTTDVAGARALYARMIAGMTRTGMVLHTDLRSDSCSRADLWIDAQRDVVRQEEHYLCNGDDENVLSSVLYQGTTTWYVDADGASNKGTDVVACRGSERRVIAVFLSCAKDETVRYWVRESDSFQGSQGVSLRSTGEFTGIDSRIEFDAWLYVDETSGLPIALERKTRDFYGGGDPVNERYVTTFTHEFVSRASLPADFFEPAGIGYDATKSR